MGKVKQNKVQPTQEEVVKNKESGAFKILQLKSFQDSTAVHQVLAKEHTVREKSQCKPEKHTIFLKGVPPFVTEEAMKNAFGKFGVVKDVFFHSAPCASEPLRNSSKYFVDVRPVRGFKVAYVVFKKQESARKAILASSEEPLILFSEEHPPPNVLHEWMEEYNKRVTMDVADLTKEVNEYMEAYDKSQNDEEQQEKSKRDEEEAEDGWVTVSKKSGIPRKESVHKHIMKRQNDKTKKSQLMNFYRFQIRESKMNQLVKLREKFEDDKKRITHLKESRKFKPF